MTTVLQYLVIAAVIGLLLFGIALVLFGRGERLAALPARTSPARLPERNIDGADVRRVRFALAVRGYRMSDVDWTLDRLADELDRTRQQLAQVTGATSTHPQDLAEELLPAVPAQYAGPVALDGAAPDETLVPATTWAPEEISTPAGVSPPEGDDVAHPVAASPQHHAAPDIAAPDIAAPDIAAPDIPAPTGLIAGETAPAAPPVSDGVRVAHDPRTPPETEGPPVDDGTHAPPATVRPGPDRPGTPPGSEA